ncbi:MAG: sugar transporter [Pseudomonadota bacterium]
MTGQARVVSAKMPPPSQREGGGKAVFVRATAVRTDMAVSPVTEPPPAAPAAAPSPRLTKIAVPRPVGPDRRTRPWLAVTFCLAVLCPLAGIAAYLAWFATPQFETVAAFSVRKEDAPAAAPGVSGFNGVLGTGTPDAEVLYGYLGSRDLVALLDESVNLRARYGRVWPQDRVFRLPPEATIEDLSRFWGRMTALSQDTGTGVIEMRVRAFTPEDAEVIAVSALAAADVLVNRLSDLAREDTLGHASREVAGAAERLEAARSALLAFREANQIVDPQADLNGHMGVLENLQTELANELIRSDLLALGATADGPRLAQSRRRIGVIEARIAEERAKLASGARARGYAATFDIYERLRADVEFSEETYAAARTAEVTARAEARRQSRYLAVHIRPGRAERATWPDAPKVLGMAALFLVLAWGLAALVVASLRDRR